MQYHPGVGINLHPFWSVYIWWSEAIFRWLGQLRWAGNLRGNHPSEERYSFFYFTDYCILIEMLFLKSLPFILFSQLKKMSNGFVRLDFFTLILGSMPEIKTVFDFQFLVKDTPPSPPTMWGTHHFRLG